VFIVFFSFFLLFVVYFLWRLLGYDQERYYAFILDIFLSFFFLFFFVSFANFIMHHECATFQWNEIGFLKHV